MQRQEELSIGVKTIETYQKLRKKGVSKAIILATFPQMEKIVAADESNAANG